MKSAFHSATFTFLDVVSVDPDLTVVSEREVGLIGSPSVSEEISTAFNQGVSKYLHVFLTILNARSVTEDPLI